jgi:hypothetical protein
MIRVWILVFRMALQKLQKKPVFLQNVNQKFYSTWFRIRRLRNVGYG